MNASIRPIAALLLASACLQPLDAQVSINIRLPIDYGSAEMIDVRPGTNANGIPLSSSPLNITAFGDGALFTADMGSTRGRELWFSDGTVAGTRRVKNLYPLQAGAVEEKDEVGHIAVLNGRAFFAGRGPNGVELWVTDGTDPGTQPFADINPGSGDSKPQHLTRIGKRIFFGADDGTHGLEPWSTDGQAVGMIADIYPGAQPSFGPYGSNPRYFAGFAETLESPRRVVFLADDGVDGQELWFTDGSTQNTYQLADILPGQASSQPLFMTPVTEGDVGVQRVVFSAKVDVIIGTTPDVQRRPFATDFTPEGTIPLKESALHIQGWDFVRVDHQAYFAAAVSTGGFGIWRTDGTPAGTDAVYTAVGGTPNPSRHLTAVGNDRIYAAAVASVGQNYGTELVRFGVQAATGFGLYDIQEGGSSTPANSRSGSGSAGDRQPFAVAGNKIFMSASRTPPTGPAFLDKELCVVDNGATAQPEHWGCGSSSLEADDPVIGTLMTLRGRTRIPNATSLMVLSRPGAPIQIPGLTGCPFFGDQSFLRNLAPETGASFGQVLQIPNDPSLHLQTFLVQTVVISNDNFFRLDLSNPLRLVLGSF